MFGFVDSAFVQSLSCTQSMEEGKKEMFSHLIRFYEGQQVYRSLDIRPS